MSDLDTRLIRLLLCVLVKLERILARPVQTVPPSNIVTRRMEGVTNGGVIARRDPRRTLLAISSPTAGARVFPSPLPSGVQGWTVSTAGPAFIATSGEHCELVTLEWVNTSGGAADFEVIELNSGCRPVTFERGEITSGPSVPIVPGPTVPIDGSPMPEPPEPPIVDIF